MRTILVVDDEASVRYSFKRGFGQRYRVLTAASGQEGIKIYSDHQAEVVFLDQRMPMMSGLETLAKLHERDPSAVVVIMTAYGDSAIAIEAMRGGAFDYITKPLDNRQIEALIQEGVQARCLKDGMHTFANVPISSTPELVGQSPQMQAVYKLIGQVAGSDSTVLIRGESGTGKELAVRAIHDHSSRRDWPLVIVNCAAIPETLLESELFGYEKGAFSGADQSRIGKFELAGGGTIFLDEVGDMTPATQTKILRALQEKCIERLGGKKTTHVDVRVVAATHRDLEKAMVEGSFREDLYWRLNVVPIYLPPLRERVDDIPVLLEYFVNKHQAEPGRIKGISLEALAGLKRYHWPGNVRELENCVRRALVLCRGECIRADDLPCLDVSDGCEASITTDSLEGRLQGALGHLLHHQPGLINAGPFHPIVSRVEEELVRSALRLTEGNQVKAAERLGITRTTLRKKMEKFGLS